MNKAVLSIGLVVASLGAATADGPWDYKFSLDFRGRGESRNNKDFNSHVDDHRTDGYGRFRAAVKVGNKKERLGFFLQIQESYDQFNTPTLNDNQHQFDLYQGYFHAAAGEDWNVTIGRQEFSFGDSRLVGNGEWNNYGRTWDALRFDRTGPTKWTIFGGKIGVNGQNPLGTHPFLGGVHATLPARKSVWEAYWFYKNQAQAGGDAGIHTVGSHYVGRLGSRVSLNAEGALQFGEAGGKDIEAGMAVAALGLDIPSAWKFRFEINAAYASGGSATDSKVRTFDQLYPTNHKYYGIADYQGLRNLRGVGLELSAMPTKGWRAAAQYHFFQLDNTKGAWFGDGGASQLVDPTGTSGRDVGRELDLLVGFVPNTTWSFEAGWGRFMPGDFVEKVSGNGDISDFLYLQARYRY